MSCNQKGHALSQSKGFAPLIILIAIAIAAIGSFAIYKAKHTSPPAPTQQTSSSTTPTITTNPTPTTQTTKKNKSAVTPTPTKAPSNNTNSSSPTTTPTPTRAHITLTTPTPTPSPTPLPSNPLVTDSSGMEFSFSAQSVNATIKRGTQQTVLTITSLKGHSYDMYGYPTSYGPGINMGPIGGTQVGQTIGIYIYVLNTVELGTHTGAQIFKDLTNGTQKSVPVTVTVTN